MNNNNSGHLDASNNLGTLLLAWTCVVVIGQTPDLIEKFTKRVDNLRLNIDKAEPHSWINESDKIHNSSFLQDNLKDNKTAE